MHSAGLLEKIEEGEGVKALELGEKHDRKRK
jgi:hypothetical protein